MANIPYWVVMKVVLTANATGTLSYQINTGERLRIKKVVFDSTGAFTVTGISDSDGNPYSNANTGVGILSLLLQDAQTAFISMESFLEDVIVEGNKTFYINVLDTSGGGNTIHFLMQCVREKNN